MPLPDAEQRALRAEFLSVLAAQPLATSREGAPGHVTASAAVLDAAGARTALVHHRRLGLWVQPGGHLEADDGDLGAGAVREVREELGLTGHLDPLPILLSKHPAPCRPEVDWHLDVQHLVVASETELRLSEESNAVRWWPIEGLPDQLAPGVDLLVRAAVQRWHERSVVA
ncbi:MAG: NUDIX hydrolase [Actinomycetales bacterium]